MSATRQLGNRLAGSSCSSRWRGSRTCCRAATATTAVRADCRTRWPRRRPRWRRRAASRGGAGRQRCGPALTGSSSEDARGRTCRYRRVRHGRERQPSTAQNARVDTFAEIADERRGLADLLSGLTAEQRAAPSLCGEWSVLEVVAHLVGAAAGEHPEVRAHHAGVSAGTSTGRTPGWLVSRRGGRTTISIDTLRRRADSRFTPPGAGPEAPLTDLLVHGLDICWPLGLTHPVPAERWRTSLTFLTTPSGPGSGGAGPGGRAAPARRGRRLVVRHRTERER